MVWQRSYSFSGINGVRYNRWHLWYINHIHERYKLFPIHSHFCRDFTQPSASRNTYANHTLWNMHGILIWFLTIFSHCPDPTLMYDVSGRKTLTFTANIQSHLDDYLGNAADFIFRLHYKTVHGYRHSFHSSIVCNQVSGWHSKHNFWHSYRWRNAFWNFEGVQRLIEANERIRPNECIPVFGISG